MALLRGLDVAALQGHVPWDACRKAGVGFAWLRGVIGNEPNLDSRFLENALASAAEGIPHGGYAFAYPLPHLDPVEQVEHFCRLMRIGDHVLGEYEGELPPALDLEWPPPDERAKDGSIVDVWKQRKCTGLQILRWGARAIQAFRDRTGVWPILYTYPYFWKRLVRDVDPNELVELFAIYANCPLWMADYRAAGRLPIVGERPFIPEPWASRPDAIIVWQHDGNGGLILPGSGVDCDWNVLLGGEDALARLIGKAREAPKELVVDLDAARNQAIGLMVDEVVSEYRRTRIDQEAA